MSQHLSDERIRSLLSPPKRIAVVGLSPKPERPSNLVARYLLDNGYTVIPVNPGHRQLLGFTCYPDLASIPLRPDIVDIFRRPEEAGAVVDEAIAVGARSVWMQLGIVNAGAGRKAAGSGLDVVMDRCIKVEHARLFGAGR